jgi:hypothetical protein
MAHKKEPQARGLGLRSLSLGFCGRAAGGVGGWGATWSVKAQPAQAALRTSNANHTLVCAIRSLFSERKCRFSDSGLGRAGSPVHYIIYSTHTGALVATIPHTSITGSDLWSGVGG